MGSRSVFRRTLGLFGLVLLLAGGGVFGFWYWMRWHETNRRPALADLGLPDQPFTVLFMGCDLNYRRQGDRQIPDVSAFNGRSDTMILVRIDPQNHRITGVHIPRDTVAEIPGYGTQRINAANAYGGAPLAESTVSSLLGVPIDHYVVLNLQGLVDAVNELGGVTINVPKRMSYMDWTAKLKIDLQPGQHTLTGNQAMGFVRFRHDELGDIGRIQRQQLFLHALAQKIASPPAWPHIPQLLAIAERNVSTDIPQLDLLRTFNLLRQLPPQQLRFAMLPGRFGASGSWIPDQDAAASMVARLYGNDTTAGDRSTVTISVRNVSSYPGLGRRVSDLLRHNGYSVVVLPPKNADASPQHHTRIIAQQANFADAQLVRNDLGGSGEIINESIGDIYSKITVLVDDDLQPLIDRLEQQAPAPLAKTGISSDG